MWFTSCFWKRNNYIIMMLNIIWNYGNYTRVSVNGAPIVRASILFKLRCLNCYGNDRILWISDHPWSILLVNFTLTFPFYLELQFVHFWTLWFYVLHILSREHLCMFSSISISSDNRDSTVLDNWNLIL